MFHELLRQILQENFHILLPLFANSDYIIGSQLFSYIKCYILLPIDSNVYKILTFLLMVMLKALTLVHRHIKKYWNKILNYTMFNHIPYVGKPKVTQIINKYFIPKDTNRNFIYELTSSGFRGQSLILPSSICIT